MYMYMYSSTESIQNLYFLMIEVKYMTFPNIAIKPTLTAESRGGFLLPQTREIWLAGHL